MFLWHYFIWHVFMWWCYEIFLWADFMWWILVMILCDDFIRRFYANILCDNFMCWLRLWHNSRKSVWEGKKKYFTFRCITNLFTFWCISNNDFNQRGCDKQVSIEKWPHRYLWTILKFFCPVREGYWYRRTIRKFLSGHFYWVYNVDFGSVREWLVSLKRNNNK